MSGFEVNFDGLVGPTHHYAGLSIGNEASSKNRQGLSNPRKAALQGLKKMKALADRGFVQGILPPQSRPNIHALRQLGFLGNDERVIQQVATHAPELLSVYSSASSMWTANAATISPSSDSQDHKVHLTAANLNNKLHRSQEALFTTRLLKTVFPDSTYFSHHDALPNHEYFGDEGAANHNRFCNQYTDQGLQLFIYGKSAGNPILPRKYPARQTLEACQAISRLHRLNPEFTVFAQQNPDAIDHGVFHNDVIAVSNRNLFLHHEKAFLDKQTLLDTLQKKSEILSIPFLTIEVPEDRISLDDAVASYLFNSQLLSKDDGKMVIIVPEECQHNKNVWEYLSDLIQDVGNPVNEIIVFDLRESMRNGGGPACLRLRVVLTEDELKAVNQGSLLDDPTYEKLTAWILRHYRDRLHMTDLADSSLLNEVNHALDELTQILELGSIYDFQH